MRALARAILNLAAFLELSGDDAVDADAAVSAMEDMAATLQTCTPEEKETLRALAVELAEQERGLGREDVAQFYMGFMEHAGLAAPARKSQQSRGPKKAKAARPAAAAATAGLPSPSTLKRFWMVVGIRQSEAAAEMIRQYPALTKVRGNHGITALQWVANCGDPDLVRLLLDRGAEINAADDNGDTALHWTALGNSAQDQKVAQLLIDRGADVTAENKKGQTPRQKAKAFGKNRVLLKLAR